MKACTRGKPNAFRTLIVDDSASFRELLYGILSSRFPSIDIEEAENGTEALDKIESLRPDLIFMDIRLPGENGLELTKKINTKYPHLIIVILTSYDLPEYREAALRNGADHFMAKGSATGEEIVQLVRSLQFGKS
jgi:DNA-binding NarL/FixJ family response regulator